VLGKDLDEVNIDVSQSMYSTEPSQDLTNTYLSNLSGIEIEPQKEPDYKLSTHEGEEFIFVLNGEIEINYGRDIYLLNEGDSIYLDSIVAHNIHAAGNKAAKILGVVYTPV